MVRRGLCVATKAMVDNEDKIQCYSVPRAYLDLETHHSVLLISACSSDGSETA